MLAVVEGVGGALPAAGSEVAGEMIQPPYGASLCGLDYCVGMTNVDNCSRLLDAYDKGACNREGMDQRMGPDDALAVPPQKAVPSAAPSEQLSAMQVALFFLCIPISCL